MKTVLILPPKWRIIRLKQGRRIYYHAQEKRGRKYFSESVFNKLQEAAQFIFTVEKLK